MKDIHIKLTVGGKVEIDEDTDLFAGVYSTSDCVERVMLLKSDCLTLAQGSIEISELCRSMLTTLRNTLGEDTTKKVLAYLRKSAREME